ncbi:MAG: DUF3078 domain-containing protein [Bacteroidaceae bacterium]
MRKLISITLLLLTISCTAFAQEDQVDKKWLIKGITGLNASQTSLVNWSSGGDNTVAGNIYLNLSANYKYKKYVWDNDFAADYGTTYTKQNGWVKSVDKLELATKFGYEVAPKWYLSALADLRTQFDKGYKNPDDKNYISKFFAPAYSNIALGMDYKPSSNFSLFMSPITGKMTFVQDDYLSNVGAFGVDPGDKFKGEFGAYVKSNFSMKLMTNVNLISKADFFTSYDSDFGHVDVNWENVIGMKINKFLTATVQTTLKYDNDVKQLDEEGKVKGGAKVQFKEMIGVGIAYNF